MEICTLLEPTMRTLILLLVLMSCSEPEYQETVAVVTGIEITSTGCIYSIDVVIPYQRYPQTKIADRCGKYKVGQQIALRWIAN